MKIIVPLAGQGTRLKPHTNTIPKPLMDVAGKPILEYVIEECKKLKPSEIIFVVGYKRNSIKDYIVKHFSQLNCSFIYQKILDGDGSAVRLALEKIEEEEDLYVIFGADTLIDFSIEKSIKTNKDVDAIVFTKKVKEPSHYGIVNIRENYEIYEVEEKPGNPKSDLAIIGAYYFKSLLKVKKLLLYFYNNSETIKGEYKIAQILNTYVQLKDKSIKAVLVNEWFDCGRPETLLEANRYFLEKNSNNKKIIRGTSIINPPSYVANDAIIENCVIGPYASIGSEVIVKNSVIKNTVISYQSIVEKIILIDSIIGKQVTIEGKKTKLNIGEKSVIEIY